MDHAAASVVIPPTILFWQAVTTPDHAVAALVVIPPTSSIEAVTETPMLPT
jgi:hypothetical protein